MIQIKRHLLAKLLEWKDDSRKKPIILRGARQVGKSYLARHLGTYFNDFIEINFEFEKDKKAIFEKDRDPHRIIRDLEIILQKKARTAFISHKKIFHHMRRLKDILSMQLLNYSNKRKYYLGNE